MREIKFRGKSDTDWVYGHLLKVDDWNQAEHEHFDYFIQTDVMEQEEYNMYYITDNNTIGQFTGLHDKNGKEIYEEDIVSKEVFDDTKPNYINKSYAKVVYIEELAGFYLVNKSNKILWEVADDKYNIEVVSTIYENPELLERSSNGD